VTRVAYAEAFRRVTGRPLVHLPQMAGRIESEIFFDALALNEAAVGAPPARKQGSPGSSHSPGWTVSGSDQLLAQFTSELAASFGSRQALLPEQGRVLPGALEAVSEVSRLHGVVQAPLTGTIKPNAVAKLRAFGLAEFFDVEVGRSEEHTSELQSPDRSI
jgi:phosphoglycolate phosphatase